MDWLNYHHLLYFYMVAREGSVTRAAETLHLAQPTLSAQIMKLEKSIGEKLFDRVGRSVVLTRMGETVFQYAEEIFSVGQELSEVIKGRDSYHTQRLTIGIPDVLPKLIVYRLLQPVLKLEERVQITAYEGKTAELLSDLANHKLDLVLADSPVTAAMHIRAFNHELGECGVTVFGTQSLARRFRKDFPESLEDAPMLLPTQNTSLRRGLEQWFHETGIRPRTIHEFEDSALLKVFGSGGEGMFPAPSAIQEEICRQYGVDVVGDLSGVREKFFAISVERRIRHPAVIAISRAARDEIFADSAR